MLAVAGLRQEQDMYIRLIDSATKQVLSVLFYVCHFTW